MTKTWKDLLLSSGLPLEYSVKKILEEIHAYSPDEYFYERPNENGLPTYFSVDIHALKQLTEYGGEYMSSLDLLIECKYRHDSVKWIFSPQSERTFLSKWQAFNPLDATSKDVVLDKDNLNLFCQNYQFYRKGIEITDNSSNPKSIEQGISQLKYGVVNKIIDTYKFDLLLKSSETKIHTILPIIVTTADIWGLNPAVTIDEVKNTNKLEEVAEKKDIIFLYSPPDSELTKYSHTKLASKFTPKEILDLNNLFTKYNQDNFEHETRFIETENPSFFAIITYKAFKKEINKIIHCLKDRRLYGSRKNLLKANRTTSRHDEIPF